MHESPQSGPSRRELGAAVAALVLAPAGVPAADEKPRSPVELAAEQQFALIEARFGKQLTAEQLKRIRAGIVGGLATGERLRRRKLTPADEPAFVFTPDPV